MTDPNPFATLLADLALAVAEKLPEPLRQILGMEGEGPRPPVASAEPAKPDGRAHFDDFVFTRTTGVVGPKHAEIRDRLGATARFGGEVDPEGLGSENPLKSHPSANLVRSPLEVGRGERIVIDDPHADAKRGASPEQTAAIDGFERSAKRMIGQSIQRQAFEQIIASPIPTTVEIREILLDLEQSAKWIGAESQSWGSEWRNGAARLDGVAYAEMMRKAAETIDRLGCELIAQDRRFAEVMKDRDAAERAYDDLKPKYDFAVSEARRLQASNEELSAKLAESALRDIPVPVELAAEARELKTDVLVCLKKLNDGCATQTVAERIVAHAVRRLAIFAPGQANAELVEQMIEELRERIETLTDTLDRARSYDEDERRMARNVVFQRFYNPDGDALQTVSTTTGAIVDCVAEALGLKRIGA